MGKAPFFGNIFGIFQKINEINSENILLKTVSKTAMKAKNWVIGVVFGAYGPGKILTSQTLDILVFLGARREGVKLQDSTRGEIELQVFRPTVVMKSPGPQQGSI